MKHKAGARRDHATTLRLLFQIMAAGDSLQTRQTPRTNMVGRGGSIVVAEGIVVDAATVGATDPNALTRFLSSATNLVWTQRVIQVGSSKNLPEVLGAAGAKSRLVHIKTLLAVLQKRIVADSREEFGGLSPTPFTLQLMSPSGQKMRYIHGTNDISHAFEVSISSAFFSLGWVPALLFEFWHSAYEHLLCVCFGACLFISKWSCAFHSDVLHLASF
jgi:hypothetical protein